MSSKSQNLTLGTLIALLRTGATWSSMAGLAGFSCGSDLREHCIRRGLRRSMHGRQVIVIVEQP